MSEPCLTLLLSDVQIRHLIVLNVDANIICALLEHIEARDLKLHEIQESEFKV